MILIPLEVRDFKEVEHFDINLVLEQGKSYEMAVINIYPKTRPPDGIGSIVCDAVNPSITNPHQILATFSKYNLNARHSEFYIIDTFNLRRLSLKLTGIPPTSLALTIAIRPVT